MPPIQGLRGSRSYSADATPKNWREGILRLYPNGGAVLTALSALLEAEQTSDPEFSWWERPIPVREAFTAGGSAVVTTLAVSLSSGGVGDPGKIFRKGYILQVSGTGGTGEKLLVTADQTVGTSVAIQRAFGETAGAIVPANATLRVVGNANEEGGPTGTPVAVDPTKQFNYTQIFRTPLYITRTAKKTRLRTEEAIVQAQIEALENQAQDMEYSFLFGERYETTGTLGQPMRTTRGIVPWISTLAPGNVTTRHHAVHDDRGTTPDGARADLPLRLAREAVALRLDGSDGPQRACTPGQLPQHRGRRRCLWDAPPALRHRAG